jgi:hypothetical protein
MPELTSFVRTDTSFRAARTVSYRFVETIIVTSLCVAGCATYAIYAGQDGCWDQRNYHIYVVHAWLTGRTSGDVAPAQIQTWLNPFPHLLQYWLVFHVRPVAAGASMGALAGLNGTLLWMLARRFQGSASSLLVRLNAAFMVGLGLTGSMFLSFLGTTFAEYLCSPFVLGGLLCLTTIDNGAISTSRFLLSGLLLGAACGLKLTNLVYALGMSAALLVLWPLLRFRFRAMVAYAVGGIVGFALLGGYWAAKLWLEFRNPMFPFFNGIFRSPWFEPTNFSDSRSVPQSLLTALVTYPFEWLLGGIHPTAEPSFRDPRFAFVAALLPLAIVAVTVSRTSTVPRTEARIEIRRFWLLMLFFGFSFIIWLKEFGIQRYALPLELLTGVVLFNSLEQILSNARARITVLALLTLFAVLWTRPADWEHVPYGDNWFGFTPPPRSEPSTLFVMLSWRPTSYVVPYLPQNDQYVRLGGNMPLEPGTPLGQRELAIIQQHTGPIKTLTLEEKLDGPERARLERFGLTVAEDSCTTFRSRMDTFRTCTAVRLKTAPPR